MPITFGALKHLNLPISIKIPVTTARVVNLGTTTKLCLFVFVALRPMSTAMVIAGRSVHLTTLFPGQA